MNNNKYYVGGSLPINWPTYVIRQADEDLYQALKESCYCYVLNCRQMGKSSLGVRTMQRLQNDGIVTAFVDLTQFGSQSDTTREKWYWSLIDSLLSAFELWEQFDLEKWWHKRECLTLAKRFSDFVEQILLKKIDKQIVIFIDEIDSILSLEYCLDDFFALIRYFYNQRSINPEFKRLTFALLGVATPSDLIQDRTETPFNIGTAIELQGFQLTEVQPLTEGLQEKADDTQAVMKEILRWTGGQPFLTQKICKLVSQIDVRLTTGYEKRQIEEIVISKIINNWEDQDNPPHLRTIKYRILEDENYQINLLETYRKILEKDEIQTEEIDPEILLKLRLSGLVVQQTKKVKVYNNLYKAIFNSQWIDNQLATIRPYAQSMKAWFVSHSKDRSKLLKGKDLEEALRWKDNKNLSQRDYQYLNASKESKYNRNLTIILLTVGSFFLGTIGSGFWFYEKYGSCPIEKGVVGEKIKDIEKGKDICFRTLITSGEKIAFLSSNNFHLSRGTEYFKKGDYSQAIKLFQQAIQSDVTDPVSQIYLNNARARLKGNPLKLAVVVSIDYYEYAAKEVLRGVADAQTEFNERGGKNNRLLEIVIANDGNEPPVAEKIAKELADKKDILGVIGHHASESSYQALPIYKEMRVAMVSPTSSSSKLKGDVFFRAVNSTKESAHKYAQYIKYHLNLDEIIIFYDKTSLYSNSLQKDFKDAFNKLGGKIVNNDNGISISDPNLDIEEQIENIAKQKSKAAFLIASVETNSVAIAFNRINGQLPSEQKIQLLSSMSLSEEETKQKGKNFIEGMVFVSPCLAEKSDYMKQAAKRWEKTIYWRVATSYDATQAFIKAIELSKEPTREEILQNLHSVRLPVNKTSGFGLSWNSDNSNTMRKFCIIKIHNHKFEEILEKK
ncbi:AAA-like domain-containing protein [Aetokthonos hydrillicola Thurmond2011]|jgi:ABC-type branched-subunit amino acid transport system substrate-binding protein|uniref:AAA-like domain-containing protein n=1 Tax=Aetokthonos hydrillicola Thurmond2011 TaxID=2712845 RepID=A0AAP5ICZ4_9CYAN|nr:AAA-like domain-containing protein [Aetokthonos hydrillicola]MBO3461066.1 ABC transporter substrate-binding protein [Aetokthonos hydrillicola CCALA 1050]MBW4586320.1 AAA-like domain-containing protein [Aetokthonos hydrillicola CCALA 1050]MDR9897448.1 AAA-like domain-containing protein [Aetokthonos hydrillicola Thurmond2011]